VVEIDIWGDVVCALNYDQINITGTATLNNAELDINLYNDVTNAWYNPTTGSTFKILTSGNLMGNFMEYPGDYVRAVSETGHKRFSVSYAGNEVTLTTLEDIDIDIAINEIGCARFEVVMRPSADITALLGGGPITNVQFTVKWPEAAGVVAFSPVSPYFIMQQGGIVTAGGYNYATFIGMDLLGTNWNAGAEYPVLTFVHDQLGTGTGDFIIMPDIDPQAGAWGNEFYVEYLGTEVTGAIYAAAEGSWLDGCPVHNETQNLWYYVIEEAVNEALLANDIRVYYRDHNLGLFVENVTLNVDQLKLYTADLNVKIDGAADGVVVAITANGVTLEGFTIQNSGVTPLDGGVLLQDVTGCTIEGNTVINNANGIALIMGSGNEILDNVASNNSLYGIALAGSTGNTIELNNIGANGLDAMALDNYGVLLSTGNSIQENTITSSARDGIFFGENCNGNFILCNSINSITGIGISLWRSGNQEIVGNTITNALTGIRLLGSSDNEITNNVITDHTEAGIKIDPSWQSGVWYSSDDNLITENYLTDNIVGLLINNGGNQNPVFATCNWWGSANVSTVAPIISGPTTYMPFLITDDELEGLELPVGACGTGFYPAGPCEAPIPVTVFLQGPFADNSGTMNIDLNPNQLPVGQPYNQFPWNYAGAETLPVPLPVNVVDWVLVELRDSDAAGYNVIDRAAALVQNNGGVTAYFTQPLTEFYVVVYHRNHMPVMSENAIDLNSFVPYHLNLTKAENVLDGSTIALVDAGGYVGMIAGDVTHNGQLKYSGPGNDRGPIIAKIMAEGGANLNSTIPDGYWYEDVNMDNLLSYLGAGNDRAEILYNLGELAGNNFLNATYNSVVPGVWGGAKDARFSNGPVSIITATNGVFVSTNELISNGLVDNIQFTLTWKTGDVDVEQALSNFTSDFMVLPQGEAVDINGISHQVFVSITPKSLPQTWNADEMLSVMEFETPLPEGSISIADNAFTEENNAMYYVSVWGEDFTGEIKAGALGSSELAIEKGIRLYPNPSGSGTIFLELSGMNAGSSEISIFDMQGRMLQKHCPPQCRQCAKHRCFRYARRHLLPESC
jgi:parallel beta-helix repeat protein